MENQTRYDLNAAIEAWRSELAAQPNLTSEVRRELETHLRDAIVGFQQRGMSDAEAFCLARHRVGQPQRLGKEFVKANPIEIWREKVLWMLAALLAVALWNTSIIAASVAVMEVFHKISSMGTPLFARPYFVQIIISSLLHNAPLVVLVVCLMRRDDRIFLRVAQLLKSRERFLTIAGTWFLLNEGILTFRWFPQLVHANPFNGPTMVLWSSVFSMAIWPLALIIFIAWLLPSKNSNAEHSVEFEPTSS